MTAPNVPILRRAQPIDAPDIFGMLKPHFFKREPHVRDNGVPKIPLDAILQEFPEDRRPAYRTIFERAESLRVPDRVTGYFAPFTEEELYERIDSGLVVIAHDKYHPIIATGTILPREPVNGQRFEYEIARVMTHPDFLRQGHMKTVVQSLETMAKELGVDHVRAVSKGTALHGFLGMGYTLEAMPNYRADQICAGCNVKDICPETALIKNLYAAPTSN